MAESKLTKDRIAKYMELAAYIEGRIVVHRARAHSPQTKARATLAINLLRAELKAVAATVAELEATLKI